LAVLVLVAVSANVPLAPEDGALNVTTMPLAGEPLVVTIATSAIPKAPLTAWLCGVPLLAAITGAGTFPTLTRGIAVVQLTSPIRHIAVSTA
jgi:hypothetical protein